MCCQISKKTHMSTGLFTGAPQVNLQVCERILMSTGVLRSSLCFQVCEKVNGFRLGWALGAALDYLQKHWRSEDDYPFNNNHLLNYHPSQENTQSCIIVTTTVTLTTRKPLNNNSLIEGIQNIDNNVNNDKVIYQTIVPRAFYSNVFGWDRIYRDFEVTETFYEIQKLHVKVLRVYFASKKILMSV